MDLGLRGLVVELLRAELLYLGERIVIAIAPVR